MREVAISKRTLIRAAIIVAIVVGVAYIAADVLRAANEDSAQHGAVEDAAAHALSEIMWFDHTEGQARWSARIAPLCTGRGLLFWAGPLFADQVWPTYEERQYVTQSIEVLDATVVGEGTKESSVVVEVSLRIAYTADGESEIIQHGMTNQVTMVQQDGAWLMDAPPPPE